MGCGDIFKSEFRCNRLGFACSRPQSLFACQWKCPVIVFLIYKFVFPVYTSSWLIYNLARSPGADANSDQSPLVFLTTWSYILLTLHLWVSFLDLVYMTFKLKRSGYLKSLSDNVGHQKWREARAMEVAVIPTTDSRPPGSYKNREPVYQVTWYHGVSWVLRDMISGAAPMVTIIYFGFLYPLAVEEDSAFAASALDINIHGINTVIMLIDNFVSAVPVRLLHVIYPILYGLLYVGWSILYFYLEPEKVLYPKILDWNYPEITIPVIIAITVILIPLLQLSWFGWYRLRLWVFQKCYKYRYSDPTEV